MRKPVGARLKLPVAELLVRKHNRNRVRPRRRLRRKQLRQRRCRQRMRRRVPLLQQPAALRRRQNIQPTDRNLGRRDRSLQQTNQPTLQNRNARPLKQVGSIVEPQLQPLARRHHQAQRIVGRIVPIDAGQPQTAASTRQAATVDRVVLKHHQAVEQRPRPDQLLDLDKAKMLVRNQLGLAVLHLLEQLEQRLRRRKLDPQRQRVDEQPHHAFDAGNLRRPARHRHPKHNLLTPAHAAEQEPPRHLHEGIERQTMLARLLAQRRAQPLTQRKRDPIGRNRCPRAIGRRQTRGLFHARQSLMPSRARPGAILRCQPRQIIAVGRHPPQRRTIPLVLIEREQLTHQHRQRPAIHQQMMVGEHQPMPIRRKADQRKAHQRRTAKIKPLGAILRQHARQALLAARVLQQRQINPPPARRHPRNNDLHRTAQPLVPEAGAQARMTQKQRLNRRFQRRAVERPLKTQFQLHHVDVRRLRIIKRMEQQPLLQRRQRQHVLNPRIMTLQPLDLALRERYQRQIARAATARPRRRMPHKLLQRRKPALRQIANLPLRHNRRRPRPVRRQFGSPRPIKRERIDLKAVRKRHGGVAALPQPHSLRCPSPVRTRRRRKPPEIVEADLRRRKAGKLRTRSRVQIPQQPIAKPVAWHRAQLLLDQLERPPKRRSAPQSLLNINPAHIQPHRIETGEPAHRARKIDIPRHLLAPVTLHINQHRSAGVTTTALTPLHNGQRQPGEQHMLDAAMERRRHPRQQPLRDRSRQRQRQPTRRANRVARRIERAVNQRQRALTQQPPPERKLANARRILRPRRQPLRPPTKRGPPRRQRRHGAARNRLPRRRKLRHQDAPRHPVNRKMMDGHQQTPRMLRSGIKPHRLHQHSRRRRKPALRRSRMLVNARLTPRSIKTTNVDPSHAGARNHCTSRRHLKLPFALPRSYFQSQPQPIVMIKHSLQRRDQISLAHPRRHLQQHRLVEAIEPPPTLQKPAHDRRRRQSSSGNIRLRARPLPDHAGDPCQPCNSLVLKHRTRRDRQPHLARSAHQLDRDDAVAPEREKVVVNPHTLQSQHLGKQRAQQLLTRIARQTHNGSPNLRRRQRTAVKLPVRRQRKTLQNNDRGRHHVVGKPRPNMRSQRRRIRLRTSRQNNIANKLRTPRTIRPRNHNRLRHARVPNQRCLDLPRLNAEAAHLNLMVRAPHKLQNPIGAPARQVPAAVHPPPRSTKPVRNKTLPRQPPASNIATPNPSPRYVKLPNNTNRNWLQTTIQYINSVVALRTPDRDARTALLALNNKSNCIDRHLGRTIKIGDVRNLEMARNLLRKRCREDLTSQHQMAQGGVVRGAVNDRFQIGRYATHKSYVIADQPIPELRGRFPDRVADNDRCPAPDERQHRLFDRSVKSTRNDKGRSEATPHIQVSP